MGPGGCPDNSFAIHAVLSQWKDLEPEWDGHVEEAGVTL